MSVAAAATAAQRRPYGLACTSCRRAKMKCVSTGLEANRCDRCVRQQKECVFESNRRGLWRRDYVQSFPRFAEDGRQLPLPGIEGRGSTAAPAGSSSWEFPESLPESVQPGQHEPQRPSPRDGVQPTPAGTVVSPASSAGLCAFAKPSPSRQRSDDSSSFTPPTFVSHSEDTRGLSLDTALDPERTILDSTNSERTSESNPDRDKAPAQDDPITTKILSRPSAQSLFADFFTHFNYLVGLLDPELYTFSYTRDASSFLFTVILSISSRVFRPDLHQVLRQHAETLLGKVLLSCDSAIENIWAIVCMYYWKDVGDKRGYTLVGFALRMAASAEWNKTRRSVAYHEEVTLRNVETEMQVRQRRDKDRVWLSVANIDRTSSYFTDRPLSAAPIVGYAASRDWLSLDGWTFRNGDAKAVGGHELTTIARPVYDFMLEKRESSSSWYSHEDNRAFEKVMAKFNEDMVAWGAYWAPIFAGFPQSEPCLVSLVYFFRDYMIIYFNSVLLHRILASNGNAVSDPAAAITIATCYSSALSLLQETVKMGKMDILYFFWDTAHLMTAYAAMLLLKLLKQGRHLPGISVTVARSVLVDLANIHSAAAGSLTSSTADAPLRDMASRLPAENAVDAQARLLRAIVVQLKTEFQPVPSNTATVPSAGTSLPKSVPDRSRNRPSRTATTASQEDALSGLVSHLDAGAEGEPPADEMFSVAHLTDEMDFSLDSSYMDARFMDVGLLSWDEPGIFIEPH